MFTLKLNLFYGCFIYIQIIQMLQNKIYQNYTIEILRTFFTILVGLSGIAWTVRAVNFLDLIVESGYPVKIYFFYSILNLFGIMTKFFPLAFLLALTIFILRQIQERELIIIWTSGVQKIKIVNLFLKVSLIVTVLYLIFSVFITPLALNKSRMLLSNEKFTSFIPTIRVQQFSDSFSGLTFVVDEKVNNQIKNIFLQDNSNVLKNVTAKNDSTSSTTIIASNGIVNDRSMVLFNGQIISTDNENNENDFLKFDQLKIDLGNIKSNTIKKPKVQETSTYQLIKCIKNKNFNDEFCNEKLINEMLPVLNRRVVLPFFIPVITLIACLALINHNRNFFLNKINIFLYSFFVLLYAETIIRYTGINKLIGNIFLVSPPLLIVLVYLFLKIKLSKN